MAPIVHGLEDEYEDRIDFVYLDVSDPQVEPLLTEFGFESTPHFFLRSADGHVIWSKQGSVGEDELRERLAGAL